VAFRHKPEPSVNERSHLINSRALVAWLACAVLLAALAGFTAWNLGRDPAVAEAEAAQRNHDTLTSLRRSLDGLERNPGNPRTARLAALALSLLIYPDEAEPYWELARRRGSFSLEDANARALGFTRANRREEAVAAYEDILRSHPDDPTALQRLAAVQWSRGHGDEALAAAERLAKTPTGAISGHTILAGVHHDMKHTEQAIASFRRVLELDPELKQVAQPKLVFWEAFAEDLLKEGQHAELRERLARVIEEVAQPILMDLLGEACLADGSEAEAERWWRHSLELDTSRIDPWLNLARLAIARHDADEALAHLARALELRPENYEVLSLLSATHRGLGQSQQAQEFQLRANRVRPSLPAADTGMGSLSVPRP
jgi:tetratricopeptide (TPR) repeat protein